MPDNEFRAIADYLPVHGDEIALTRGDIIVILHSYDDGWCLSRNTTTQSVGLIPRNFIDSENVSPSVSVVADRRVSSMVVRPRQSTAPTIDISTIDPDQVIKKWQEISKPARQVTSPNIGSFIISIAGDSGIGKTCFVNALLKITEITVCETLPVSDGAPSICEVRASTIPESQVHYNEDQYNMKIIDTPGFGSSIDTLQVIKPVVDYHLQQFLKTDKYFDKNCNPITLQKFICASNGATSIVHVCIYGILHRITPVDVEYMKRLSLYVNVIPVILKCDTLKQDEVFKLKVCDFNIEGYS